MGASDATAPWSLDWCEPAMRRLAATSIAGASQRLDCSGWGLQDRCWHRTGREGFRGMVGVAVEGNTGQRCERDRAADRGWRKQAVRQSFVKWSVAAKLHKQSFSQHISI